MNKEFANYSWRAMMSNRLMRIYYFSFILVGLINHPFACAFSSEDKEFIEKYSVDKDVAEILDQYTSKFIKELNRCKTDACDNRKRFHRWEFDDLPDYLVKFRLDRITGRELMHRCIEANNLTCLTVPRKWIYHIKGKGRELTNYNYLIVAERHRGGEAGCFSSEEIKQICVLIKNTGYKDLHWRNILRLEDGRISFIDTEFRDFDKYRPWNGLVRIFTGFNLNTYFSEESFRYIFKELLDIMPEDPASYKRIYNKMLNDLSSHPKPLAWDYISCFKSMLPDPENW